jgi:hypothetical protein
MKKDTEGEKEQEQYRKQEKWAEEYQKVRWSREKM